MKMKSLPILNFIIGLTTLGLFIFLFLAFFSPLVGGDIWWHLKLGEWIVAHQQVPSADPFAITEASTSWMYTQWLGGVLFYTFYQWGGLLALKILLAFWFLVTVSVFVVHARRRMPAALLLLVALFLGYGLLTRLVLRPFIFNFIFIQLFLIQLYQYEQTHRAKSLWPLLPLGMLWGNLHLGSFVYALLLIGIFWFSAVVDRIKNATNGQQNQAPDATGRPVFHLGLLLLIYPFCFLISPYGLQAMVYPFEVFLLPHFINFYRFNNLITEMQPPVYLLSWSGLWFAGLVVLALGAIFLPRKRSFTDLLLLITALFMFLHSQRASAFFAIISAYVTAHSLSHAARPSVTWIKRYGSGLQTSILIILLSLLTCLSLRLAQAHVILNGKDVKRLTLSLEPATNPVAGVNQIQKLGLRGLVFSPDGFGGYILWAGYPQLNSFVDGRQCHQDLYAQYLKILQNPRRFWSAAQSEYNFQAAILASDHPPCHALIQYLTDAAGWQILAIDGPIIVFVPNKTFKLAMQTAKVDKIPPIPGSAQANDIDQLKAILARIPENPKTLWRPAPYFSDKLEEGIALYGIGYERAGIRRIIAAAADTPVPGFKEVLTAIIQRETDEYPLGGKD